MGSRPAIPVALLFVATLLTHLTVIGALDALTPALLCLSLLTAGANVAAATAFLLILPRRGVVFLQVRRSRIEDLLFVIAIGSFSAPLLVLGSPEDKGAAAVLSVAIVIHLAVALIARRAESVVRSLGHRLRVGPSPAAPRHAPHYANVPMEAARLFFGSIRENHRLRRLSILQGLRLESARRRVDRMQQTVTTAERIAREKELASDKAASVTTAVDARWRAFAETVPDALIIVDTHGFIEYANSATRQLTGHAPEQLLGTPVARLIPLRQGIDRQGRETEALIQDPFGKERELSLWVQDFSVLGTRRTGVRLRDVSGLRYVLKELKHARSMMGSNERSRDHFIATMSHEIRTPLHGLMATLDLLRVETLSPEGGRRLSIARTSARTLLNIANDILDLSRIEAGAIPLERKAFSLKSVLNEALDEARASADFLMLEMSTHVTGRLPQAFLGDPARIKQILRNLLANALKFTPSGSVTMHAHYDGEQCVIDVKDTGEGVPDDKRESIFDPFVQAESASSRRFGGAGLGLPISRRLSETMGGSLVLLRSGPSGSTFRVILPLQESDEPPVEEQSQRILRTVLGRILVVEDDPASQYVAQTLLESLQCPVTVVATGVDALDLLGKETFDLVFMDCEMPGLDGYETTQKARALLTTAIPIIGMTASAMSSDKQRCVEAGMDDVLPKPFAKSALNEMLCKWLSTGAAVAGKASIAERIKDLPALDRSVFDELWQSLQWRMPAMRRIYDSFVSVTDETLEQLAMVGEAVDPADTARRVHSLIGSAGLVGARQIEYLAGWLGDALKERTDADVEETLQHLREALGSLRQELKERFDSLSSPMR